MRALNIAPIHAARTRPLLLVLYWNPYGRLRSAVAAHLRAVCAAGAPSVVAVNAHGGASATLRRLEPDAIALHTTFLSMRWTSRFAAWRERSSWVGAVGCPVLAFPQDEYDHARVLDEWLVELGTTALFTVLPGDSDLLFPRTGRQARIRGVLTGYVPESRSVPSPPMDARSLDVVYRATHLPYWFGRLGQRKVEIAEAATNAARRLGLRSDIALDASSVITGDDWFRFLAAGRTVVGAESGSSVVDPDGSVRAAVRAYLAEHPDASYDEVTCHVSADWDAHDFAAVSPRHFEAAMTRTAQVLVRGDYSGVLRPDEHYVPVEPDFSDMDEALQRAIDPDVAGPMVDRAHTDLVADRKYSYDRFTAEIREALPFEVAPRPVRGLLRANALAAATSLRLRLGSLRRAT